MNIWHLRRYVLQVQAFLVQFKYLAIFAALVGAGVGVPIPEEVTQLTAGALAHAGILDLRLAIPVAWAGIVAGDFLLFTLARRNAERMFELRIVRRFLTPQRREILHRHFARHAFLTIAVARHTGGIRLPTFVVAATHGVSPVTFVLADALSALLSVPVVVGLGYAFWGQISRAQRGVQIAELVMLAVVLVAAGIAALRRQLRA